MSSDYEEPKWSSSPTQSTWSLDEIKNGTILQSHPLNSKCVTFGRAEDQVSIPTAHPSCSRLHARIAFHTSSSDPIGTPWLRDLGSGHGTLVNKKLLPKKSIGKMENSSGEGSRGVILFPGDMIQFGASTRIYCLVGPPEKDRQFFISENAKLAKLKAINHRNQDETKSTKETMESRQVNGISWGMDIDYDTGNDSDNQEEQKTGSPVSHSPLIYDNIPPKQQQKFQRLTAKKHKLANLQLESERIMNKGFEGLTAGQSAQLERNATKEEKLKKEIINLEQEIRDAIRDKNGGKKMKRRYESDNEDYRYDEDDDVDDFYDRTKHTSKKNKSSYDDDSNFDESQTEEEVIEKWTEMLNALDKGKSNFENVTSKVSTIETRIKHQKCSGEDTFFLSNDLLLAQEELNKLNLLKKRNMKELDALEKMLKVCTGNMDMTFDRRAQTIYRNKREKELEQDNDSKKSDLSKAPPEPSNSNALSLNEMPTPSKIVPSANSSMSMLPPLPMKKTATSTKPNFDMPPPSSIISKAKPNQHIDNSRKNMLNINIEKRYHNINADKSTITRKLGNESQPMKDSSSMPPPPRIVLAKLQKIRRVKGPTLPEKKQISEKSSSMSSGVMSTASFLARKQQKSSPASMARIAKDTSTHSKPKKKSVVAVNMKEDTWQVPEGQDGSGVTKLNAKFAGRY